LPDPTVEELDAGAERLAFWILVVHGALALVAGILLLAWPDRTLLLIGVILGSYLIVYGVLEVFRGLTAPGRLAMERAIPVTVGLLAVAAGTLAIARPDASVLAVALAVGIYLIVAGLAAGVTALREPDARLPRAAVALVSLTAGVIVVAWPDVSLTVVAVVFGVALVVRGAAEIVLALYLTSRRAHA
jgi:uncharacterized membrane protein HdeD (DUF308 family)